MLSDSPFFAPRNQTARFTKSPCVSTSPTPRSGILIEAWRPGIRDYQLYCCSLNNRLEDKNSRTIERMETLDQEAYLLCTGA